MLSEQQRQQPGEVRMEKHGIPSDVAGKISSHTKRAAGRGGERDRAKREIERGRS